MLLLLHANYYRCLDFVRDKGEWISLSFSLSLCVWMFLLSHNLHWFKQFEQHAEGRYFMPFVRLYIYHENDLFSLILLFRVLPIIKYTLAAIAYGLFRCTIYKLDVCASFESSGIASIRSFSQFVFSVCAHSVFSSFFFYFILSNHKYFLATRFILLSFTGSVIAIRFG